MDRFLYTRYKGKYRVLAEIDRSTNDFPRDSQGNIDDGCEFYISCQHGNKIFAYGTNGHREMQLCAYIPSLTRGRNIKKKLQNKEVPFYDYDESDEEVVFKFSSNDIDVIAGLLKAKTAGANISPLSTRNLPKSKESLPDEKMREYKAIVSKLGKNDMLVIKNINSSFMNNVLAKRLREKGKRKPYDYVSEQKKMGLAKDVKTYIYKKGMFDEYLKFLSDKIDKRLGEDD